MCVGCSHLNVRSFRLLAPKMEVLEPPLTGSRVSLPRGNILHEINEKELKIQTGHRVTSLSRSANVVLENDNTTWKLRRESGAEFLADPSSCYVPPWSIIVFCAAIWFHYSAAAADIIIRPSEKNRRLTGQLSPGGSTISITSLRNSILIRRLTPIGPFDLHYNAMSVTHYRC